MDLDLLYILSLMLFDYAIGAKKTSASVISELSQLFDLYEDDFKKLYYFDLDSMETIEMVS